MHVHAHHTHAIRESIRAMFKDVNTSSIHASLLFVLVVLGTTYPPYVKLHRHESLWFIYVFLYILHLHNQWYFWSNNSYSSMRIIYIVLSCVRTHLYWYYIFIPTAYVTERYRWVVYVWTTVRRVTREQLGINGRTTRHRRRSIATLVRTTFELLERKPIIGIIAVKLCPGSCKWPFSLWAVVKSPSGVERGQRLAPTRTLVVIAV